MKFSKLNITHTHTHTNSRQLDKMNMQHFKLHSKQTQSSHTDMHIAIQFLYVFFSPISLQFCTELLCYGIPISFTKSHSAPSSYRISIHNI